MYREIQAFSLQVVPDIAVVVRIMPEHKYSLDLSTDVLKSLYITKNNSIALRTSINGVVAITQRLD